MAPTMTVEEYRERQRADLEYRVSLSRTEPERAKREAIGRLQRAGILDENGELAPRYRH